MPKTPTRTEGSLLPPFDHVPVVTSDDHKRSAEPTLATRDHDVIRKWAEGRGAEPATGEATTSGPATVKVNDGGAGLRFNFPGAAAFRRIPWDEWFEHFDRLRLTFVFEGEDSSSAASNRYRIVRTDDWPGHIR